MENTNTVVPAAPVIGQAPENNAQVVAPVAPAIGQADLAQAAIVPPVTDTVKVELPQSTPQVGQGEAEVDKNVVVSPPKVDNEYGTPEVQIANLRKTLNEKGIEHNTLASNYEALEKDARAMQEWIDRYSPVLERALGENADPVVKEKLLAEMPANNLTPQGIQEMIAKGIEEHTKAQQRAADQANIQASREQAYNSFMDNHSEIKTNATLTKQLLETMQTKNLPLTNDGYEAALYFMNKQAPATQAPVNPAQQAAVNNAILAGGAKGGGVGTTGQVRMFDLNKARM